MKLFKLPSVVNLLTSVFATLKRFPLGSLAAVVGTVLMIYVIELRYDSELTEKYVKIILTCTLLLSSGTALTLFFEARREKVIVQIIGKLVLLGLGVLYYYSLSEEINFHDGLFYVLLNIAFHLLVSFAPYIFYKNHTSFWRYNKGLFLRILTAVLYTLTLFLGLAMALLAIENLFGVDWDWKIYSKLFAFLAGIFNTLFFLSGVPTEIAEEEEITGYPNGLKVFTQFVLLPLAGIYLTILYLYAGKIMMEWTWPDGWVTKLVLGYSVLGILSFLLIWPLRKREEDQWINIFAKWFFISLLPLIVLLSLAIYRRVGEYGITELRYLVIMLAVWLFVIAVYFIVKGNENIKLIPLTLFFFVLFSSFGFWGAFSVSRMSQKARFERLLQANNMLKDGKIVVAENELPFKDRKNISSIIDFFTEREATDDLQHFFSQNLDSLSNDTIGFNMNTKILKLMGMDFVNKWQREGDASNNMIYYYATSTSFRNIKGFDYEITLNGRVGRGGYEKSNKYVEFNVDRQVIEIYNADTVLANISPIDLVKELRKEKGRYPNENIKAEEMMIRREYEWGVIEIDVYNINGEQKNDTIKINNLGGMMYINFFDKK